MIDKAYVLTAEERDAKNSTTTPASERMRLYGRDLRATAQAYAVAADAPGLRKDAAKYLFAESMRLTREGGAALDRADELETQEAEEAAWTLEHEATAGVHFAIRDLQERCPVCLRKAEDGGIGA
jgi:hypothetical protein